MLLIISIVASVSTLAAILLFWRLRLVSHQLDELKPTLERGAQIADSIFGDLSRTQAELSWINECNGAAAQAAEQGLWQWHLERDQWTFSAAWKKLLGYGETELESSLESWEKLLHPEDRDRVIKKLKDFADSRRTVFDAQYRLRHRNGTYRWFHSRGSRVPDQPGDGEVLVAMQQDVTESKQMEAAMMESQMRFRSLYDTAPICFVQWDKEGRIVDWNKHAEAVFGWSKAEVIGRPVVRLFSEIHQEFFLESVHKLIEGAAATSQLTSVNLSSSNSSLYLEWTSVVLRSLKGTVTGVISLGIDVTARKKEEDELMQYRFDLESKVATRTRELEVAQESLTQIIEGTPLPTFVTDAQHRVTHWNKACAAMFDVPSAEIVGHPSTELRQFFYGAERELLAELVLNNDLSRIRELYQERAWPSQLIAGAYSAEVLLTGRNLWLSLTATPLSDNKGNIIGAIETMEDISQRKIAEEKLMEAKRLAEEAAKIKADFLANMSHEIRTPMNAIIGLTHLALKTQLSAKQRDYLEKISSAGSMLFSLVNDVLDFSKIEAGKLTLEESEFVLDEALINTSTMVLTRAQDKGLELRFCIEPEVPQLLIGDSLRFTQVLVNLVGNAIKFTEKGSVTVSMSVAERRDDRVTLAVEVSDTGIGMTPEQASRLFQAFSQADTSTTRKFGGTGLGLIICKRIVELMGGEIALSSEPGRGTTFSFHLCCGVAGTGNATHNIPEQVRGARVLIVDDDASWCEMFRRMLLPLGLRPECITSPEAALERLVPGHSDPFTLVFIDWHMPGVDGITLASRIKERYGHEQAPALIIVSMSELQELEQAIGDLAVAGVLIKPVTALHVANLVSGLFDPQSAILLNRLTQKEQEPVLKGARVLLVDDVATNQIIGTELLTDQGVDVHVAGSGPEAIAALTTGGKLYDAVLMDIQMPEMDGYEATRRIRSIARFANLPIIAMTAHAMEGERSRCLEAGMNDFITKPIIPDALFRILAHWITPTAALKDETPPIVLQPAVNVPVLPPAAPTVTPFSQLRGIDTAVGLQFMMNKPAVYEKVLKDFYARFKDAVHDVRLALSRGDLDEARRQAHSLKSLAGSIGATALSAAAKELEIALIETSKPDSGILETFEETLAEVLEGLSDQFMIQ